MPYKYQLHDEKTKFEENLEILKERKGHEVFLGWPGITYSESENRGLMEKLEALDIRVERFIIDKTGYEDYLSKVRYKKKFPKYYSFNFPEKTLEYYLAYTLIAPSKGEVFVDIAAENSPHYKEFEKLSGARGYKQDLMYKPGIRGREIGGDASGMPVSDNFFDKAFAACSLEHFEEESDINFISEMGRALKPGGKLVVLPLYLHKKPFVVTDPRYSVPGNVKFDEGIDIHCVETYQNRHGRFYSPETLNKRLILPNKDVFKFRVLYFENFRDIDKTVYCRFALEAVKK
ncbi:MAG: class I SAM-dependent methyltransferase [Acidobacteriota bacterium]